jgi:hypothetical protein
MKGRQIERLARKHLLPVLPGFSARGALVYRRGFDYFLHALSFETSSFTRSRIYVAALIQPLYGPDDDLRLTYGFRLGNDFWDVDDDDPDPAFSEIARTAQRDALPFFEQVPGLEGFAEVVPAWAEASPRTIMREYTLDDPVVTEDLAYTAVLRGERRDAIRLLEHALEAEREDGEYASEERIANLEQILDLVRRFGLKAGQAQLEEWRARTIETLGLEP